MLRIVLHVTGSELRTKEIYRKTLLKEQGGRFMTMNRNVDKIHTTIGELVVALSDAAFKVCAEKRDAYFLVALALKQSSGRARRDKAPYVGTQLAAAYPGSLVVVRSAAAAPTPHLLKLLFRDAKRNSPTTFRNRPKILGIVS